MTAYVVAITETFVRVVVVEAGSDDDAVHIASRHPRKAWRVVHYDIEEVVPQPLDGVPLDDPA